MSQTIHLKELERKAFTSYFQDGLWEILLGLVLLYMGSGRLLTYFGLSDAWGTLIVLSAPLFLFITKKSITTPRLGRVKFGPKRRGKLRKAVAVLCCSVLVGIALSVIGIRSDWHIGEPMGPVLIPLKAMIVLILIAYFMAFSRLYAYGALIAAPISIGELLDRYTRFYFALPIVFGVSASITFLTGTVLLIRFLRNNPLPVEETTDGDQ